MYHVMYGEFDVVTSGAGRTSHQNRFAWSRPRGWPLKRWTDNITEWMGLKISDAQRVAQNREVAGPNC